MANNLSQMKLGKRPARPDSVTLRLASYVNAEQLPTVPKIIGNSSVWPSNFRDLGNFDFGDCVFAGFAHEIICWRVEAGYISPLFTNSVVLSDYSAVTGFKSTDPSTDKGTDVQQAAAYRQKTGVIDSSGQRHKIDIYTALRVGDCTEVALATFLFGAVGIGVNLPTSAMDQFRHAEPWDVVQGSSIEAGHYIPIIGRGSTGNFICVTWGRLQAITPAFLATYMDEGICWLSREQLTQKNLSPAGFDFPTLQRDFHLATA